MNGSEPLAAIALPRKDIQDGANRISCGTINTRFEQPQTLSKMASSEPYLKFEKFQFTASFKDRGAPNTLLVLQHQ
ncbi:MAG: hypothetical protein ACKVIB_09470 [Pseudomonadales bacterium]